MSIDFHSEQNQRAYSGRGAHSDWLDWMRTAVDGSGKRVADIGCGGGIYTAAWIALGAAEVIGVDFSLPMTHAAREALAFSPNVTVRTGEASHTGLEDCSADIVFERALIHHLPDRAACFQEAYRILVPGGMIIIQDRTPDDIALPGTPEHIRGYFFEAFPRLLAIENARRPNDEQVRRELPASGFSGARTHSMWETRKRHVNASALAADLKARTGRSILHELTDKELEYLIAGVLGKLSNEGPVTERDRWTIWIARK